MSLACCVLAGCERAAEEQAPDEELVGDSVAGVAVFNPSDERQDLPTSRIYFTLTDYEWYARGQPLLHDGRGYRPQGMPMAASLADMEKAGEFEGVEYYVRSGDPGAVLYVPVFSGYWQAFQLDASAAAMPVDEADPVDAPVDTVPPDTSTARD